MTVDWVDDDQLLLAALGDAVRERDAVPDSFVAAGKACFAWHGIDAELAQLSADSALHPLATATRTEQAEVRALTFAARELTIELEITRDTLHGQLVPPQPGELELELRAGETGRARADELGYFAFDRAPVASFRLRCRTANGVVVTTGWVTL
jgi:hypothetical protein